MSSWNSVKTIFLHHNGIIYVVGSEMEYVLRIW